MQALLVTKAPSTKMRDAFAAWSHGNWTDAGLTSTLADARARWDDLVNSLDITDVTAGGEAAISVTPTEPAAFVGRLLAEGQAHLMASDARLGAGPLDKPIRYFVYHAGVEPAKRIFTRSLLEVHETSPSPYTALRDEIRADATYSAKLNAIKPLRNESDQAVVEAALTPLSGDTMAWLAAKSPTRLSLLINFLETASGGVWNTWTEQRGNLSRYMVLLDYYKRLFS